MSVFISSQQLRNRMMKILFDVICLVSSSFTRRLLIPNATSRTASSSSTQQSDKVPPIKVALCIQRYAQLSPEMNQLEKDYTDLITQLEVENSYLSDHELRHKREL